jgi:hypothetical protein
VIAYLDVARLDFVHTPTGRVHSLAVPSDEEAAVRTRKDGSVVLDHERVYYRGCVGLGHRVLGLFSGRQKTLYPGTEGSLARFIHIFNDDGTYVGALVLDRAVSQIAVAPDDSTIYASIRDQGEVWRYTVPARLRQ